MNWKIKKWFNYAEGKKNCTNSFTSKIHSLKTVLVFV